MNLYQKLIEVRKTVPYLKKDNAGHQFQYVSSSQTLGTVRAKMDEMGLLLVPSVTHHEVRDHTTKNGGHEYFTDACITFTWVNSDNPKETLSCEWLGQGLDSGEKGVGKALTYAEKYFILKFFNIATDRDDPDSFQERFAKKENPQELEAKWVTEADNNAGSVDELGTWYKSQKAAINNLPAAVKKKVNGYVMELKDALSQPDTITCPNSKAQMTSADCAASECSSTYGKCKEAK